MPKNTKKPSHDPVFDEYEDALGESGGDRWSEYTTEARYNTCVQNVSSVGGRTVDWMKRDLLVGSTGDDRRNWPHRTLLKNEASFLVQPYDVLASSSNMKTIREARAFDYFNRRHQFAMLASTGRCRFEYRAAACASICPTSLYRTTTLIPHRWGFARKHNVCMNSWVCPHCYARLMVREYGIASCRLTKHRPAYIALLSEECNVALGEQELCKSWRAAMRASLKSTAQKLGGTGGLWTVQIEPVLKQKQYWDVNEASYEDVNELVLRVAVMAYIPQERSSLTKLKAFVTGSEAIPQGTSIDVVPAWEPGALRSVMVKGRNISKAAIQLEHNRHGLFHWPTMTLCSPVQWHSRFLMTRFQKSVRAWGDWTRNSSHTSSNGSKSEIKQRRESLLEAAMPVLIEISLSEAPSPGRVDLQKKLADFGVETSERQVRWLIKHVRQNGIPS